MGIADRIGGLNGTQARRVLLQLVHSNKVALFELREAITIAKRSRPLKKEEAKVKIRSTLRKQRKTSRVARLS